MPTVTHPLALATAKVHPWDDAVIASQAEGEAIDARIAALAGLVEATPAAHEEIWATAQQLSAAAGREGGQHAPLDRWFRNGIGTIRTHAVRLFGNAAWVADIRGPNWRP